MLLSLSQLPAKRLRMQRREERIESTQAVVLTASLIRQQLAPDSEFMLQLERRHGNLHLTQLTHTNSSSGLTMHERLCHTLDDRLIQERRNIGGCHLSRINAHLYTVGLIERDGNV